MKFAEVLRLFDSYNRTARLYPSLITVLPIIVALLIALSTVEVRGPAIAVLAVTIAALLYFLTTLAQWRGKAIESRLLAQWGGWPSTIILRHRDLHIDRYTKARYHSALSELCPDLELPDEDQEAADPDDADAKYRSATRFLLENRRGSQYSLLLRENAKYGFRRNLLALKPAAILISIAMAFTVLGLWAFRFRAKLIDAPTIFALLMLHSHAPLAFAFFVALTAVWIAVVRPSFVKSAAVEYAEALFRTLDVASGD